MSIDSTLKVRGTRYGDFSIHAAIAQNIMDDMRNSGGWEKMSAVQKQALTVIADKIARILSGDPNYDDNWHDIQGYAKLVEDRLPKEQPPQFASSPLCKNCGKPHVGECEGGIAGQMPKWANECMVCHNPNGHNGLPCPQMKSTSSE
jgi:hypothetical protein